MKCAGGCVKCCFGSIFSSVSSEVSSSDLDKNTDYYDAFVRNIYRDCLLSFEIKGIDHLLFLSDVAFVPYPNLETKANIIRNTVEIAHACGIECPKVAPIAAVEVVNPKMPCTVDADELTKMNENGEIEGCIVDGPLSLDLAIEPQAAFHKGTTNRKIVGDADVLLFPDIHAGNITYKALVHTAECKNGNILTGTKAPVILTSRSDEFEVKVNSIALAAIVAEKLK